MNIAIINDNDIKFLPFDLLMFYNMAKYIQHFKFEGDYMGYAYDLSDAGGPVINVVLKQAELCPKPKGVPVDEMPDAIFIDNGWQTIEILLHGEDLQIAVSKRMLGHPYFDAEEAVHGLVHFVRETEERQKPAVCHANPA